MIIIPDPDPVRDAMIAAVVLFVLCGISALTTLCFALLTCLARQKGWRWWLAGIAASLGSGVLSGVINITVFVAGAPWDFRSATPLIFPPILGLCTGIVVGCWFLAKTSDRPATPAAQVFCGGQD